MAKKKAAKPKATARRKAAPKKQSKKAAERILRSGPVRRRTTPKDQPLPGMEDTRIAALDDVAGRIADIREDLNRLRGEEAEEMQSALNLMRKHEKTAWRAHGVEFVRVPGEERLRVRTSRERATAETLEEPSDADLDPMDREDTEQQEEFATAN